MVSTVPESINRGLNCKTNQKARYWDDAACIAGEAMQERRCLKADPKVCVLCRAGTCLYGE